MSEDVKTIKKLLKVPPFSFKSVTNLPHLSELGNASSPHFELVAKLLIDQASYNQSIQRLNPTEVLHVSQSRVDSVDMFFIATPCDSNSYSLSIYMKKNDLFPNEAAISLLRFLSGHSRVFLMLTVNGKYYDLMNYILQLMEEKRKLFSQKNL